jgi:hypothetical protein
MRIEIGNDGLVYATEVNGRVEPPFALLRMSYP